MYRRTPTSRETSGTGRGIGTARIRPRATPHRSRYRFAVGTLLTHPQGCYPVFNFRRGRAEARRDGRSATKRRRRGGGSGWRVEMVSGIVGVWVAIPPAFPGAVWMTLPVVNFAVVVRVPANSQRRLLDGVWIVRGCECHTKFEMAARVGDECCCDLLRCLKTRLQELEYRAIDRRRASTVTCGRHHRCGYPDTGSVSVLARC